MSKRNYRDMYKQANEPTPEVAEIVEDVTEEIVEETVDYSPEVEEVIEEIVEEEVVTTAMGVVAGCSKLNVRKNPNPVAQPLCVIAEGTEVMVDFSESTNDWYKVYTKEGVEGFCMKSYISVK